MRSINIENQKFGYLTALFPIESNNGRVYKCRCDCGNIITRKVSQLRHGKNRQSCGCQHLKYYEEERSAIGLQFDKLIVIKRLHSDKIRKSVLYLCKCDCGNFIKISYKNLSRRKNNNCGCEPIHCPNKYSPQEAAFYGLIGVYKSNAKKRKISFQLSDEECKILFNGNCHYCGTEPLQKFILKKNINKFIIYNGIDRFDSNKHYSIDNAVSCCTNCNTKKSNMSYDNFLNWIKRVYEYNFIKN